MIIASSVFLFLFIAGCTTSGGEQDITFEQGLQRIQGIFLEEGEELPNFDSDLKEIESISDIFELELEAGLIKKADLITAKLKAFNQELAAMERTEDVLALTEYTGLLIDYLESGKKFFERAETGLLDELKADFEEMSDVQVYCSKYAGSTPDSFAELPGLMKDFEGLDEKCSGFVSTYPEQAKKANVKQEYCDYFSKGLVYSGALEEMLPLMGELCGVMISLQDMQFNEILSDPVKMCEDTDATKAEYAKLLGNVDNAIVVFEKFGAILEKYPELQSGNMTQQEFNDTMKQMEVSRELMASLSDQIEQACELDLPLSENNIEEPVVE